MEEKYILAQWLENNLSPEEAQAFQTREDFLFFEKVKQYSSELTTTEFNKEKILNGIFNAKQKTKVVPIYRSFWFRVAAIFILVVTTFFAFTIFAPQTYKAELGEISMHTLPDNSIVQLNSGSELVYKKFAWEKNRNVTLKGEGFFKVAKGSQFKVETKQGIVQVLGTQFNVKNRGQKLEVTCYEGKVQVKTNDIDVVLLKGMNITIADGKPITRIIDKNTEPTWLNEEIDFYQDNLSSVVKELERKYVVSITVKAKDSNQLFTGTIPANNLDAALEIIATTYHLKIQKNNSKEIQLLSLDVLP